MVLSKKTWAEYEAHQQMPQLLRELKAAADLSAANAKLGELCGLLKSHFAEEEAEGGLFEELRDVRPSSVPYIKSLLKEHGAILAQAAALQAKLEELGFEKALPEIVGLCEVVHAHHTAEHQLFLDAYLVDHGGS